jgi:hypothetical protein
MRPPVADGLPTRVVNLPLPAGPTGLEPATSGVTVRHSNRLSYGPIYTSRNQPFRVQTRAGNRARTGDLNLGKVALYQLSYARESSAPTGSRTPLSTLKGSCPNR